MSINKYGVHRFDLKMKEYSSLKATIVMKMFMTAFFVVILCNACQSTSPPTENNLIATSLPTAIPLPTSTVAVDNTDTASEITATPRIVTQLETLYFLQGNAGQIVAIAFSPDDRQLISLAGDFTLKQWDVNSGEELSSLKLQDGPIYNGAISSLGNVFAVEGSGHTIQLRGLKDGQILHEMPGHSSFVMSFTFSWDGKLLATGDDNGSVQIWEVESGSLLHSLAGHPSPVGSLAFSPDKALLASGCVEGSQDIKIWDMGSGEEIMSLDKHTGNVYDLAFSSDGTLLASASGDRTVKIWDVATGEELQTLRGHRSNVYSVTFSPDGKLLVSGDFDGNIKLWDVTSGKEFKNLNGHTDLVKPVRFSNNGYLLASGSFDSTIIIWGTPH